MKGKRLIALITAMLVMLTFTVALTGCGGKSGTENAAQETTRGADAETTAAAATTTAAKEELKPVNLVWYLGGGGQPADTQLVEEAMSKILTEKINATIKLNFIPWGNYQEKMNVLSGSGDKFDLCFSANWQGFSSMSSKGAYADLTDLIKQYGTEMSSVITQSMLDAAKVKGKILAVPNLQGLCMPAKIAFRGDLYDKYKLPEKISSLDELDTFFEQIKSGEKGVTGWYLTSGGANTVYTYYQQCSDLFSIGDNYSVGVYDGNLKVVDQYESDNFKAWITWARKAYQKGWIEKNAATMKDDSNLVKSGKYACLFAGSGPQNEVSFNQQYGPTYQWKFIDFGSKAVIKTSSLTGTMTSININSENKERAMMLINLINTDIKLYNTMCFGVEGKHYIMKDGFREFPEGVTAENSGYNPDTAWAFGNSFNAYLLKGQDPAIYKSQQEFDKAASSEPAMGFNFDPTAVKSEITQTTSVLEEMLPSLVAGAVDPEQNLPKMIEKLKSAGMEKILAEKQKQLDEFLASKQ
jgi:putative aldouronate transport system substrate-binding protein